MSTDAQIAANRENAQKSTGPITPEGRAVSCMNNFRFGFTGRFRVLPTENLQEFEKLLAGLLDEHKPSTTTETILVEKIAQHHWLSQRALRLQDFTLDSPDLDERDQERQFSLYLRYQVTNDRAFHRCLADLLKVKAAKRKEEIGFESQKQKQALLELRQAAEKRKEDLHQWAVLLAEAKVDQQMIVNSNVRLDQMIASKPETASQEAKRAHNSESLRTTSTRGVEIHGHNANRPYPNVRNHTRLLRSNG